jgi:hypothetical protein
MVKTYREACAKPCSDCPFRRKAAAGWLGAATPQSFIVQISMENPLPCHQTIDYTDPDWLEKWEAQEIGMICAGSLILSRNMGKMPRDPKFPRMKSDKVTVFANHIEFIEFHEASPVRSWEFGDEPRQKR